MPSGCRPSRTFAPSTPIRTACTWSFRAQPFGIESTPATCPWSRTRSGTPAAAQVELVLHINLVELTEADRGFDGILADSTIAAVVEPTTNTRFDGDDHGPAAVNGNRQPAMTAAGLNPRYAFETFVKGQSNQFALAAAQRVAETPARSYNPLFIYGAAGLGKTHLLHAIGHYVNQNYSDYQIRYVSTETFLNEYVDAIRTNATAQFKRRYREIDVLLIDDIQFMEGKEGLQEEFFHTFNSLHGANKQIVISSDRIPDNIPTLEDRLRGRFKWGLITDIQPPDLETRLAILRNKAERDHTAVPPDVLEFIATRITNNIRELEGALIRGHGLRQPQPLERHRPPRRAAPRRPPAGPGAADRLDAHHHRGGGGLLPPAVELLCGEEPPAAPRPGPPDRHVRDAGPDRPVLPGDRPGVRWAGPHDRHPRREQGRAADEGAPAGLRPGHAPDQQAQERGLVRPGRQSSPMEHDVRRLGLGLGMGLGTTTARAGDGGLVIHRSAGGGRRAGG